MSHGTQAQCGPIKADYIAKNKKASAIPERVSQVRRMQPVFSAAGVVQSMKRENGSGESRQLRDRARREEL